MTRRHKHPRVDQLASLAAGELRPRKAAQIQAHVARCEQCTEVCKQLNAVAAILASVSYQPMPDKLSARIESAISSEARQRLAAMPSTEDGRRDVPARRPRTAAGGWHLPGLLLLAIRLTAAVGAVVIAVAGGYLVAENVRASLTRLSSPPLTGAAAPAQQMSLGPDITYGQPGTIDTTRAVESHANFVAAHLRAEAISAVHAVEAREAFATQQPASTASLLTDRGPNPDAGGPSARRLAGCVALISPGRTVLLIDIARYQGKPAALIVTAATLVSEAEAWVVGSSCSATTKDVLTKTALGGL